MDEDVKDQSVHDDKKEENPSNSPGESFIKFLHSKLPNYIVNCFITAGYDTMDVVKGIDDQKLNDIEEFINKHFPKNTKYFHPDFDRCIFPPGHRTRVNHVIKEISGISLFGPRKRTSTAIHPKSVKKVKTPDLATEENVELSLKEWYTKVRNQIVVWQRKPETDKDSKELAENTDYEIKITKNRLMDTETTGPSIHILCKCRKKSTLGTKGTSVLLCN